MSISYKPIITNGKCALSITVHSKQPFEMILFEGLIKKELEGFTFYYQLAEDNVKNELYFYTASESPKALELIASYLDTTLKFEKYGLELKNIKEMVTPLAAQIMMAYS